MEGEFYVIRNDQQKARAAAAVATLETSQDKPYSIKIQPYSEKRRIAQNRLAQQWYKEISVQGSEYTPFEIHQISKFKYGIPIMRRGVDEKDTSFEEYWKKVIQMFPTYEMQIAELMPRTPVTRDMNVKQMSEYLNDVHRSASTKYQLTDPSLLGLKL